MRLLIALPVKTGEEYERRRRVCEETWLADVPKASGGALLLPKVCDYRFFSDADLGLDPNDEKVRPKRTLLLASYAFGMGYDFMFRVDSDAYVWVNRLLCSGFEQHDYVGYCMDYPRHLIFDRGRRTAHGGAGFTLSRKAMEVLMTSPIWPAGNGFYWGDIWAGEALWKAGIECSRDTRFLDGHGQDDITPDILPRDHQYISVHPVSLDSMRAFHALGARDSATIAPSKPIFEPEYDYRYGTRDKRCPCDWCQRG